MIEKIKEKINNDNIELITKEESEIIANNNVLLELFKEKLKERDDIDIMVKMSDSLNKKILFLSDFIEKFFTILLKMEYEQTIDNIIEGQVNIENLLQLGFEIDNNTEKILNNYKIKFIPEIISYLKDNNQAIRDEFLINYIIDNNIYVLANVIDSELIDNIPKLEQFVIDANIKDNPIYLLYFVNDNIVNKLTLENKIYKIGGYVLKKFVDKKPEYKDKINNSLKLYLNNANEEQLNPNNFCFNYVKRDYDLTELLLSNLVRLKSNLINDINYKFSFNYKCHPYFDKLLLDSTNPLQIDFNSYLHFFSNKVNNDNINLYLNSLNNKNEIYIQNIFMFIDEINSFDNEKKQKIFKNIVNNGNFNKIELYYLLKNYKKYNFNDNIWIDYFKNQKNIPIDILEELQRRNKDFSATESIENIINNSDDEYYIDDYSLFKHMNKDSKEKLYNKLIDRLNNNKQVSFYYFIDFIIHNIQVDLNILNNPNIIFNLDKDIISNIITYITQQPNNQEFTNILINKFNCYENDIPIEFYEFGCLNNNYFKPTLLKFIQNKKVNIEELINEKIYLNKDVLITILNINTKYIKDIITNIIHSENTDNITNDLFNIMLPHIINNYNIDENNFLKIINTYGFSAISLLENEQFIKLLNYNIEEIDKFIELFKVRKLDKNIIVSINDSLRQNIFAKDNQDILTIYTIIMEKIQNNIGDNEINYYINELLPFINDFDLKTNLINYYNSLDIDINLKEQYINNIDNNLINLFNTNKQLFLKELFISLKNNQNIYGPYLHIITNKYIFDKRNEFSKNNDIYTDTNVLVEYDQKSLQDALFNYLLKNDRETLKKILYEETYTDYWEDEIEVKNIIEYNNSINETINFIANSNNINNLNKETIIKIKENIKNIKEKYRFKCRKINVLDNSKNLITININGEIKYLHVDFLKNVKKDIIINDRELNINEIFKNVNIEVLRNTIINDNNKYNALISIIDKYKILEWKNLFDKSIEQLSLSSNSGIYAFIDAFEKIYEQEVKTTINKVNEQIELMKKNGKSIEEINNYKLANSKIIFNPYKILKYCSIYSGYANCYKIILGLEDYEIIKANDKPYSAKASPQERLDATTKLQIKMFKQNKITIPSFIKNYDTTSKKLMAIVGNRCASFNLTHGERTGACMRCFGYADTLFNFCNTDSRGFHITFIDPDTLEYVSRVSGFRNGNTVFLNQLRNSKSPQYSDDDVITACKGVANDLILLSKNSKMPIENVVISPSYALEGAHTEKLSEPDIGKDVYKGYKDVSSNAVILATTGENGMPAILKLNSDQPIYHPVRLPILEYNKCNYKTHINIQRIKCIKECINSNDENFYKRIDIDLLELEKNYTHVFLGQDWFITIDENLNIEYDIIPGDERALEELEETLNKVKQNMGGKTL